jgi:CBS domain-containing protein
MTERSQIAIFHRRVAESMAAAPPTCAADLALGEAVGRMASLGASSLVIVDAAGRAVGILTEQDVARRVAYRIAATEPVSAAMTAPIETAPASEFLYRAIARMRRASIRHMPAVDAAGRPVGVVHLHSALADASAAMLHRIDRLTRSDTIEGLSDAKGAQIEVARGLLEDGLSAPEILGVISDINRDLHARTLEGAIAGLAAEGWGGPPVPFTLLIMGSGGRGENLLTPDQDNGFILAEYPDDEHRTIDPWFIGLAERFNDSLDRIGFPRCKGQVMAVNPIWRKKRSEWRAQIAGWIERRSPAALLNADIFLDFRDAWGAPEPAAELRGFVAREIKARPVLLPMLAEQDRQHRVALDLFGRIATDPKHADRVDLKRRGTLPLVAGVRLYAMREGVEATGTSARLDGLVDCGAIPAHLRDELAAAFAEICRALLVQQLADAAAGCELGNYVDPLGLSKFERERLVESMRAVDKFAGRAHADFTGRVW